MALPLGKLTLIVGAGLVGSVLAKDGGTSTISDFFSTAFKFAFRQLRQDESTTSGSKPKNDSLMQQVNSLREEIQFLASNRSVMIITGDQSGSGKYGIVIIVAVVGYGYIWWKGWKLSDMMFATRRGLNDACSTVAKQLETVYSSISATKKHLSSRIDRIDCKLDECAENSSGTKDEVTELRGDVKLIGADVQSVHQVVRSLETKISRIEGRQNKTTFGVGKLVAFVQNLENGPNVEQIEGAGSSSSRFALEMPALPPSRAVSLPANSLLEPPSPSTSGGSHRKHSSLPPPKSSQNVVTASGLKDLYGISNGTGVSNLSTPSSSNRTSISEESSSSDNSSSASVLGRKYSNFGASLLTRSRSAMQSFK